MMNMTRKALGVRPGVAGRVVLHRWRIGAKRQPDQGRRRPRADRRRRPAGKMLLAAIEIWRDDVNAKGGLLGRPVEVVFYDDQSTPVERAGHLHQAHHRRQSRPAARPLRHQLRGAGDADHHAAQQDVAQPHRDRHQPPLQLRQILLDGPGRPGWRERLLEGLLRDRGERRNQSRRRSRSWPPTPSSPKPPPTAPAKS